MRRFDEDITQRINRLAASLDGEHLAFSNGDDVLMLPISTSGPRKLTITKVFGLINARMPAQSPDRRNLALKMHSDGLIGTDIAGDPTIPAGTNVFIRDAFPILPMEFAQLRENVEQVHGAHNVRVSTSVMNNGASNDTAELEATFELDDEDTFLLMR